MKKLVFQPELYIEDKIEKNGKKLDILIYDGPGNIGLFELVWSGINLSEKQLSKKEHKINKRLRTSLKTISRWKDQDEDSRVLLEGGPHEVILEEDEYDLLKGLLDEVKFRASLSDEIDSMYDLIDKAEEVKKPEIVKEST